MVQPRDSLETYGREMRMWPWTADESRYGIGGGQGRIFPNDIKISHGEDACIPADSYRLVPFRVS